MTNPVYLNDKSYPVQVSTPSGTGRTIQPGFAVEGDYFTGPVSRGMPLRRLTTEEVEVFDKQKIVISLSANSLGVQPETVKPYPPVHVEEAPAPQKLAEDSVNNSMEESLDKAMKEMGTQIPTLAELKKMNMQELNAAALKHGVSKANGRQDIINQLAAKLSLF